MADHNLWPLLISDRAQRELAEAQDWWLTNREKAPDALEEELRAAYDMLLETPHVGLRVPTRKRKFMRRILLTRTVYYLYYQNSAPGIEILALWHSSRRPPRGL